MKRDDAIYWLSLAKDARKNADRMNDSECRRTLLQIADKYQRLAKWAQERGAD